MLRVLALNIWNLGGDWRARRQAILSVIRDCEADVVCLQEVVEAGGKNQAKWLAGEVSGWSWTWAGEAGYGVPCRAVWRADGRRAAGARRGSCQLTAGRARRWPGRSRSEFPGAASRSRLASMRRRQ